MFKHAALRLSAIYLGILMFISLFFSVNVYQLSIHELDRSLNRPIGNNFRARIDPEYLRLLEIERAAEFIDAKHRLINRLLLTNMVILISGGYLSYYLARRTLHPIEEAHEAQNRFTADASHELRTPLAAMQSQTEVALMNPKLKLKDAKEILASNLEELAKLTVLSESLLSLARSQQSKPELTKVYINQAAQAAVDKVLPLAEKKHILINNRIRDSLRANTNAALLSEVLVILLDNSIKYSTVKTEIKISAEASSKGINIHIKDQGIGIKASDIPHIFDRFYRADSSRSKFKASGYGLGLAIAKNLIDLIDGQISVASEPQIGTTFTISLPT